MIKKVPKSIQLLGTLYIYLTSSYIWICNLWPYCIWLGNYITAKMMMLSKNVNYVNIRQLNKYFPDIEIIDKNYFENGNNWY